ncbi:MAG: VOC family protein [Solirubrobacteraceae bacterium]
MSPSTPDGGGVAHAPSSGRAGSGALGSGTEVGAVRLTVSDLGRSRSFYEHVLGLRAAELEDGGVVLGPAGGPTLVELAPDASASPLDHRTTGLFHLAILVPTRRDLAHALARMAQARWPLDGASDHLVSEALYLSDPDGNGIEIYRDRPREDWTRDDAGQLAMATLRLDLNDLAGELDGETEIAPRMAAGTRMGHVHLQVAELESTEAFYSGVLGFDVTVRGYPGALFFSAAGYHHHIGTNTWHSAGSSPPPPGAIGLRSFDVVLEDQAELDRVLARIAAAGLTTEPVAGSGSSVRDPSGNAVVLRRA